MIGYLRYRSVLYWMNVVKNRESFCMNPAFFATAETVISRDEAIAAIRNAVPDGTLLWLQTHDDSHEKRLDFTSRMQDVLCTIWNHAPSREALRDVLLTSARKWLTLAESEGVEVAPSHPLDARGGNHAMHSVWVVDSARSQHGRRGNGNVRPPGIAAPFTMIRWG